MGSLTTNFRFYKPDPTEFVDVETQLNRNWDIADSTVRRLMEYEYSNLPVPDVAGAFTKSRFYKPHSNTAIAWLSGIGFYQDPRAFVSPWKTFDPDGIPVRSYITEDYIQYDDMPLAYRIIKKAGGTTTEVEWQGAIQSVTQEAMDVNFAALFLTGIHAEATPSVSQYAMTHAGNTTTNESITRLLVSAANTMEFYRYGANPSAGASPENRVEINGFRYCTEVTGT